MVDKKIIDEKKIKTTDNGFEAPPSKKIIDEKKIKAIESKFEVPQSKVANEILKMEEGIVVRKFAEKLVASYQNFIQAVILFGSVISDKYSADSDIDVLIIVNDINISFTSVVKNSFDLGVEKYKAEVLAETKTQRSIHSNVVGLTEFWKGVKNTDPVVINVLRTGISIYETGFFVPFKELLLRGEITPSEEGIINLFYVGKGFMEMSQHKIKEAIDALYWAIIKSLQAVLLSKNIYPGLPKDTPQLLRDMKKDIAIFSEQDIATIEELFQDYKKIEKAPNKFNFSAKHYEDLYAKATNIIEKSEKEVEKVQKKFQDKFKKAQPFRDK